MVSQRILGMKWKEFPGGVLGWDGVLNEEGEPCLNLSFCLLDAGEFLGYLKKVFDDSPCQPGVRKHLEGKPIAVGVGIPLSELFQVFKVDKERETVVE